MSTENGTGVYKYCDEHGLDILRNLEMKFTPPNEFNDPFEFTPRVINSNRHRMIKRLLKNKEAIKAWYEDDKASGKFRGNFRQYRKHFESRRSDLQRGIVDCLPDLEDEAAEIYAGISADMFGVLCLSSRRDSILMWGHYCNKHRGLVVGYDPTHDYFSVKSGMSPVNYIRERVVYDQNWKGGSKEFADYFQQLVFSKNDAWKYEGELRLIIELKRLRKKQFREGRIGYFGSFPAEVIQTVTLGAKCTKQFEDSVRAVLQDKKFAHVKLDRAVLHRSEFALEFK